MPPLYRNNLSIPCASPSKKKQPYKRSTFYDGKRKNACGQNLGDGCVIGAGSVVTRDIPKNSLAAGTPCRVLRKITEADRLKNHPELFADNDFEELGK